MPPHKYGFHVNRAGDDVLAAIERIQPRVIKTLAHDVGFWKEVRQRLPETFLIGRLHVPPQEQDRFVDDPVGHGRAFAARVLALEINQAHHAGRPLFDAWESYNEVLPGHAPPDTQRRYDDFQVAFGERLRAAGFEPVAMNFATGNFLGQDFIENFPGTLATHTLLGFHEYDWPDMWRLHEQNIREKDEGGMWLTLRYRRIMEELRRHYPDKHLALITECGMTQGVQGREDVGPWHESFPIDEERYWRSLMWYNEQLMRDDYVIAALLFVVGAVSPWHSFEHLGGIIERLDALEVAPLSAPTPGRGPGKGAPTRDGPSPSPSAARLRERLLDEGERHRVIRLNPGAALQRQILEDGLLPTSTEFALDLDGRRYLAQQAERLEDGARRVYYVTVGEWSDVRYVSAS